MTPRTLGHLAIVTSIFCAAACATSAVAAETISGTVRAAADGELLEAIDLDAFDATTGSSVVITGGSTDPSGEYTLTLPAPGTYLLRADPNTTEPFAAQYHNGTHLKSLATPIVVGAGAALTGIDFSLVAGRQISGSVTLGDAPLADIDIDVYANNGEFLSAYPARTLPDGSYTVGSLPPGSYFVRADPDITLDTQLFVESYFGGSPDIDTATPVVMGSVHVTGIDIPLTAGGTIRGTMTAAVGGAPLEGIDLDIFDVLGSRVHGNARTDVAGAYEIGAIPPGVYLLRADPSLLQGYARTYFATSASEAGATPIGVIVGARTSNIDFALTAGGTLGGTITEAGGGTPLLGIDLDIFDSAGNFMPGYTDTSDALGGYQLGPLLPGTYFVRADPSLLQGYAAQFYTGKIDVNVADPVTVTGGADTSGIDFALVAAGAISGTVRDVGSTPISGMDLDLFDGLTGLRLRKGATSAADGSYTIDSLTPGSYVVRTDPTSAQSVARHYYDGKAAQSVADTVVVIGGATTSAIDFALPTAATISGQVTDSTGGPVPAIAMEILEVQGPSTFVLLAQVGRTDLLGGYLIDRLPPGDYVVRAVPDPAISVPVYHGDTSDIAQATVITVAAGQSAAGADIMLAAVAPMPQSWDQQKCINALNKNFGKVAKSQGREVLTCIKKKSSGTLSGTAEACLTSDPRGKVALASVTTVAAETANCSLEAPDFGATDSTTVNQTARHGEIDLTHDVLGSPVDSAILPKSPPSKCQRSLMKQIQKCRLTRIDTFNRCKRSSIRSGLVALPGSLEACLDDDSKGKIAKACDPVAGKLGKILDKKCPLAPADIAGVFPACASPTTADLGACLAEATSCSVCRDLNTADAMTRDCDLVDDAVNNGSCP